MTTTAADEMREQATRVQKWLDATTPRSTEDSCLHVQTARLVEMVETASITDPAQPDPVADIHQLNSLYQDIELVLQGVDYPENKLKRIAQLNAQIGAITARWV